MPGFVPSGVKMRSAPGSSQGFHSGTRISTDTNQVNLRNAARPSPHFPTVCFSFWLALDGYLVFADGPLDPDLMKRQTSLLLVALALAGLVASCAHGPRDHASPNPAKAAAVAGIIQTEQIRLAPDLHLAVFAVDFRFDDGSVVLDGEVDNPAAKSEVEEAVRGAGFPVANRITLLPAAALGETNWGITTLSVANGREQPEHKAELGTQTLMGEVVRVLKRNGRWLLVQSHDQYLSWLESGSLKLCTRTEADAWAQSSLLIVTELDALIRATPEPVGSPVSDVVIGCRVKQVGETGAWFQVELPDGRAGYLPKASATDYAAWQKSRRPTPENIEQVGQQFIGRPYLWGANTPRGLDCSGFTKLTFFLNGIELPRNASQQARAGVEVPLDRDYSQLKKGDLLFFGFEGRGERPGRVSHTGIYLGNKLFIQSSQRVRLSSLDPQSPIADPARIRGLIKVRRVLPDE